MVNTAPIGLEVGSGDRQKGSGEEPRGSGAICPFSRVNGQKRVGRVGKTPAFVRATEHKNNVLVIDDGILPSQSDLISIIATGKVIIILDSYL